MAYGAYVSSYGGGNGAGPSSNPHGHPVQQLQHPAPTSSVPDLPGSRADPEAENFLRRHVSNLTGTFGSRFPGAQPVSFTKRSLDMLLHQDFWVCEKSDGQRVLIFIVANGATGQQEVFLIDRKNNYKLQSNLFFPHSDPQYYVKESAPEEQKRATYARLMKDGIPLHNGWPGCKDSLLDGELVWDTDKKTGRRKLRLLMFDALVVDGTNMSMKPLTKRYGRLINTIYKPFADYMSKNPMAVAEAPFEVKVKHMDLAYGIDAVLQRMPHLEHGNDGLIFTGMHSGYTFGTDEKIIKWKPPSENSIDFMLRLRFPPDPRVPGGNVPDLRAKPMFLLEEYMGDQGSGRSRERNYEPFDWLYPDDEEWEDMKRSGIQFDDRIVECVWLPGNGPRDSLHPDAPRPPGWKIHRIRDDKQDGNHHSIVQKIIGSIEDGVEEAEVLAAASQIRSQWKSQEREKLRRSIEQGSAGIVSVEGKVIGTSSSSSSSANNSALHPASGAGDSSSSSSAYLGGTTRRGRPPPKRVGPRDVWRL